jgi:hypothetical protein
VRFPLPQPFAGVVQWQSRCLANSQRGFDSIHRPHSFSLTSTSFNSRTLGLQPGDAGATPAVDSIPNIAAKVPKAKSSSRHLVTVEKASASLVGTASLRSSAAEHPAVNRGVVGASPTGDASSLSSSYPGVAQSGSAPRSGRGGRRFKSFLPDHFSFQGGVAAARETLNLEAEVRSLALEPRVRGLTARHLTFNQEDAGATPAGRTSNHTTSVRGLIEQGTWLRTREMRV